MRILLTNDDGISAPGLAIAEEIAQDLAGPDGQVWIVAPAFEQSGVSHAVSYIRPMRLERLGERRFAVEGTPADCVLAGLHQIAEDGGPPDLVISGVNRGHNVAEDTLYSGTVGGALEAALHGVRAVAMSQYHGPDTLPGDPYSAARAHGAAVVRRLLADAPWPEGPYGVFYNVNFPPVAGGQVRGVRATLQGHRAAATFGVQPHVAPNGRTFLWLTHGHGNADTAPGSDSRECHDGWVAVTPLRADLTAHDLVTPLAQALG